MKSVLISVRPKWCGKITHQIDTVDGKPVYEKTIELRKTKPICGTPFKCYIYETRGKKHVHHSTVGYEYDKHGMVVSSDATSTFEYYDGRGQVIGEFVCDEIYQYSTGNIDGQTISDEEMQKQSCLTDSELCDYETSAEQKENCIYRIGLYGWHISNLEIYDKPKELGEFNHVCIGDCDVCKYSILDVYSGFDEPKHSCYKYLKRPPQSWCFIEELAND